MSDVVGSLCCCSQGKQYGRSLTVERKLLGFQDFSQLTRPWFGGVRRFVEPAHPQPTDNPIIWSTGRLFQSFSEEYQTHSDDGSPPTKSIFGEALGSSVIEAKSAGPLFTPSGSNPFYDSSPFYDSFLEKMGYSQRFKVGLFPVKPTLTLTIKNSAVTDVLYTDSFVSPIGTSHPVPVTTRIQYDAHLLGEVDYKGFARSIYWNARWDPVKKRFVDDILDQFWKIFAGLLPGGALGLSGSRVNGQQPALFAFDDISNEIGNGFSPFDPSAFINSPETLKPYSGKIFLIGGGTNPFNGFGPTGFPDFPFVPSYFLVNPAIPFSNVAVLCTSEVAWFGKYKIVDYVVMSDFSLVNPSVSGGGDAKGTVMLPPPGTSTVDGGLPTEHWEPPSDPFGLPSDLYQSPTLYPIGRVRRLMAP